MTYNRINQRLATDLLRAAGPSLLMKKFGGVEEVPATWKDKLFDIIRFRIPSKTKLVRVKPMSLPPTGDKITFRRRSKF